MGGSGQVEKWKKGAITGLQLGLTGRWANRGWIPSPEIVERVMGNWMCKRVRGKKGKEGQKSGNPLLWALEIIVA